jgi:hypothetical protein
MIMSNPGHTKLTTWLWLRNNWIWFEVVEKLYGHHMIDRQSSGWWHEQSQLQKGFRTCSKLYADSLRPAVADRSCIVVPLVVRWCPTNNQRLCVQLSLNWSYNWKTDGATHRATSRSVVQLRTTRTDWLHTLTLGGVAAGLHLVLLLVADSPHKWHDYP